MVTMIRSDLDFILAQIKIAEADARGETLLGTYIPNAELPWGLRRVDGSNNNLITGQGGFGAAGNPFPRAATEPSTFLNEGDDGMAFGPPIPGAPSFPGVPAGYIPGVNYLNNNNYGVHTPNDPLITNPRAIQPGDVVDADPRTISNLIVDQSLNNPAAILAALKFAGSEDLTGDLAAITAARDALKAAIAAAGPAATPAEQAALLLLSEAADLAASDAAAALLVEQADQALVQADYDAAVLAEAAAEAASNAANQAFLNAVIAYNIDPSPANELASQIALDAAIVAEAEEQQAELDLANLGPDLAAANQALLEATNASNLAASNAAAAAAAYQDSLTGGNTDPAVIAARAELAAVLEEKGVAMDGEDTVSIPNVAPDVGLSAPFNGWMTLFGQFFDHGLDLVAKGGFGTVYIPLQPDDPLYNPATPNTNFMALTRSTLDASGEAVNLVTPFVDQNQTYTSHASHQVFLREYETRLDGKAYATGRLLNGNEASGNGLATWADVKAEAIDKLGITLNDHDIHSVPLLRTDPYGKFVPGANGFAQVVVEVTQTVGAVVTKTNVFIEGVAGGLDIHNLTAANLPPTFVIQPGATVSLSVVPTGVAFLDDIAHAANPNAGETADADDAVGLTGNGNLVYDDELLDQHYITGDGRGNENIGLTAVHHVFHSEHNRQVELIKGTLLADAQSLLANGASQANAVEFLNEWLAEDVTSVPLSGAGLVWDGERIFQAAKVPTEMQYQHLVFEEFARKVQPLVNVFNDYDASLNPAIVAEFAHTVYRFGHSMLTENVDRYDADFNPIGTGGVAGATEEQIGLIEAFLNPIEFADTGATAEEAAGAIIRGMTRQRGNQIDEFVTEALRNNLVGLPLDLAALNIARGRETGVPTLNEARQQFYDGSADSQIKPYTSWADFALNIKNPASVINFIAAYGTHSTIAGTLAQKRDAATKLVMGGDGAPTDRLDFLNATGSWAGGSLGGLNNVDFWIGGLAEKVLVFGGMLGSTFNFVFETQLESLQNGDRFYYLSRLANLNLTAQLENNKFSELIHRNTDARHLPGDVFSTPDFILEVDQTKQFNVGLGSADPTDPARDPVAAAINPLVQRDPATNLLRYNGEAHVVLGGTSGNDILIGGAGDDTLWGDAGDDRLEGGDGFDLIFGGDGNDIITDEAFDDEIRSGAGDDVVSAGNGINLIITDTGRDFVWAGNDLDEILLGQDDDFGAGGGDQDMLIGGEGNDWLESGTENGLMLGDNGDLIQGLPIKRSVDSSVIGHDVLVATGGNADFDAEQGDDVMVGGLGTDRFFGQFGFDWATYKNDPFGLEADMNLRLFVPPSVPSSPGAILDRYAQMEALSGSQHADILRGDDEIDLGGGGAAAANNEAPLDHALKDENVALTRGLAEWLSTIDEAGENRYSAGNILLGGSGSDIIEGRDGNDLIDGNRWLNVRIEVLERLPDGTITNNVLESADGMAALQARMFTGEIKVAQLRVVRELIDTRQGVNGETLVNGPSNETDLDNVDIAQYSGNLADYTIEGYDALRGIATDGDGDGFISITDNRANPTDGIDRLKNMERVLFADGTAKLTRHENRIAEGRATLSVGNTAVVDGQVVGVEGQVLNASVIGVTDRDNRTVDNPTGAVTDGVIYTWQMETVAGSGIFVDVETTIADEVAPVRGPSFTVTAAEAGLLIRVVARFKDADKVIETVYSNADEGGNPNEPAVIALDGFNTTTKTFADNFDSTANTNQGSVNFTGGWVEVGDVGNAIQIDQGGTTNQLRFGAGAVAGATVTRTLDLAGVTSATVNFTVGDQNIVDALDDDILEFQFSADGTTFTTLATFDGTDVANQSIVLPTGVAFTANSAIRFRVANGPDAGEFFSIDDLIVTATTVTPVAPAVRDLASSFTEGQAASVLIGSEPLITDEDGTTLASAQVVLTNASAGDVLAIGALPAGITGNVATVGTTIVATLTGTGSHAAYQAAIQAVTYRNNSDNPATSPRIVQVTVNDGVFDSDPATHTITVIPVDDPVTAVADSIITNILPGTAIIIPEWVLLGNDTDPDNTPDVTATGAQNGLAATLGAGTISVAHTGSPNSTFVYTATGAPGNTSNATVTVNTVNTTTLSETFGDISYTNDDGAWTANWVETGDTGDGNTSPGAGGGANDNGQIRINGGALEFDNGNNAANSDGAVIQRGLPNLVGANSASITYNFTENLDAGETVLVQFSRDGTNLQTVQLIDLNTGNGTLPPLSLTGPFTAGAFIRFTTSALNDGNDLVSIDNINVSFNTATATINGTGAGEILLGSVTGSTFNAAGGNDTVLGGTGNDTINWAVGDGRDVVNGGAAGTDTFVVNGNGVAEVYRVFAKADAIAAGLTGLTADSDIVITRNVNGVGGAVTNANIVAELDEIEEIVINTAGGVDTVLGIGNFNPTNLSFNTITVNDTDPSVTVDVRGMTSAHHFAVNTAGSGGTIIGGRPQDEVNGIRIGAGPGGGAPSFTLTANDLVGLRAIIAGQPTDDDDLIVGVRTLSGAGNNTGHSGYGAADTPFIRLTDAHYGDYDAATGNRNINPIFDNLDARAISDILGAQEIDLPNAANGANIFFMAFGQYFDHGLDFLGKSSLNGTIAIGGAGYSPLASANNPADLTRGSVVPGTATGTPQHINKTSAFVDQNQAYGSNTLVGQLLRESDGATGFGSHLFQGADDPSNPALKLLPTLRELLDHHRLAETEFANGKTLLEYYPTLWTAATGYNGAVVAQLAGDFMGSTHALLLDTNPGINLLDHYVAGDGRANENISLTAMHTIWARNHNFHVENLEAAGFVGTAEEMFQAAKVLNEAEYQRVVFDEFADTLIGGIRGTGSHGHDKYDPNATASISHEFAAAVYRVGHSLISDTLTVIGSDGQPKDVRLVDAFLNPTNDAASFTGPLPPGYVPQPGYAQIGADAVIGGTMMQAAEEVDFNIVDAVRNDLVRIRADLFAFNVARGRDVGLGTLNQVRADLRDSNDPYVEEAVGFAGNLDPYASWEDFQARNNLSNTVINQFKQAYPDLVLAAADIAAFRAINPDIAIALRADGSGVVKGIDRVDLWVGGLAEKHINGGMVGQTFWVVLQEQFDRLQQADRFYYTDRLDNFDLYENIIDGQNFADIIARNTGLTGLPELVFEVDDEDDSTSGSDGDDDTIGGDDDDTPSDDDDDSPSDDTDDEDDDDSPSDDDDDEDDSPSDDDDDDSPSDDDDDDDDSPSDDDDDSDSDGPGTGAGTGNTIPFVVYLGTAQSDQAFGSDVANAMSGNDGDDTLFGFGGNDSLLGGNGKDSLFGGDGDDVLGGNDGNDHLEGGAGHDSIMGGDGKDVLLGGDGDDILIGDAGNDRISGGKGNDVVYISDGDGSDAIDGGDDNDTIDISGVAGGAIVDLGLTGFGQITAAGQQDTLIGFENVIGGAGNDTIIASVKVNILNGGGGNDTFVFETAGAANGDTINGFSPGDRIDLGPMYDSLGLNGTGFTQIGADADFNAAGQLKLKIVGNDTVIEGNTDTDFDEIDFSLTIAGHRLNMNEINS